MADPQTEVPRVAELRRSPAGHLADAFAAASSDDVALRELPFRTMIGVRVEPGTAAAAGVEAALGLALPSRVGAVTGADAGSLTSVLWLGPDEFLVIAGEVAGESADASVPGALTALLADAIGSAAGAAVDLSANRTTFRLEGAAARDVLEKGCPLDLHPRACATGSAYVTRLGPVPVILRRVAPAAYEILPRASFADYLGRWLIDAMAEFAASEER